MNIEVLFLPQTATDLPSKVCVVIDVLRATSTLVSMFEAGARRVVLSESIPGALAYADGAAERPLVCGESGGLPPVGFDHGNSPREFPPDCLKGREVVFCTSNGTRAMNAVAAAPVVLAGSLLNGSAVARAALREAMAGSLDIALICSGDILGTKFAIDDAFCAGHLLSLLKAEAATPSTAPTSRRQDMGRVGEVLLDFEESSTATWRLYGSYLAEAGDQGPTAGPPREAILQAFWESHNAQVLRRVGLGEDVPYCAQLDISTRVPRLRAEQGRLVLVDMTESHGAS